MIKTGGNPLHLWNPQTIFAGMNNTLCTLRGCVRQDNRAFIHCREMPVAACISLCFPEDGNYVISSVVFIVSFQIPKAHPEGHASQFPIL